MAYDRTLTVPAVLSSLEPVNAFVHCLAAKAGLDTHRTYQLRLAVEELLTNIIEHGYGPAQPDGEIVLEGDPSGRRVSLRLIDKAARFDPATAPDPTDLDRPLHERTVGSLGLYLARQSVDELSYEYVDGTNRTTIVVSAVRAHASQARPS